MIDCSKPHRTRDYKQVLGLKDEGHCITGYVDGSHHIWDHEGRSFESHPCDFSFDLVEDPPAESRVIPPIDLSLRYRTRSGDPAEDLVELRDGRIAGTVLGVSRYWDHIGRHSVDFGLDLIPDNTPLPAPDPLVEEFGQFVAAVRINFQHGTLASATPEHFEEWINHHTPILRSRIRKP